MREFESMDISNYTAEDFVLDPNFRKWVLKPDGETNLMWKKLFEAHPTKYQEAQKARDIILHLSTKKYSLSESEFQGLWQRIEEDLPFAKKIDGEKIIPLNARSVLEERGKRPVSWKPFFTMLRVAGMLALGVGFWFLINHEEELIPIEEDIEIVYEERNAVPGVKTHVTLADGSRVTLNSGSKIRYVRNFEEDKREVFLEGEAYFEVAHDSVRPFVVAFGSLSVAVLGTSFNVSAFEEEKDLQITLVDGSIEVLMKDYASDKNLILKPGTGIVYSRDGHKYRGFSSQSHPDLFRQATEWKNGKLVFDGNGFDGFVRQIKRWYGIQVTVQGTPPPDWSIRANFDNELLTNVLEAVSYDKGFRYILKNKELKIMFD